MTLRKVEKMSVISEIYDELKAAGYVFEPVPRPSTTTSFKSKVLKAADSQLALLAKMRSASEMDYASKGNSGKYWWSGKAHNGNRHVRFYVSYRPLVKKADAARVENDVEAVAAAIAEFRRKAESKSEAGWEAVRQRLDAERKAS